MSKKEWLDWLKCNVLEIIILVLVLVLVAKVFNVPAAEVPTTVIQEQLQLEKVGETSVDENVEQLSPKTAEELPIVNQTLQNNSNTY